MVDAIENWQYTPLLFLGVSIGFAAVLYLVAWWGMPFLHAAAGNAIQRVAKNSAIPIMSQLANRAVDLVFAAFALRLLGVTGNGQYAIAVVTWLYLKTISDFGLSVLVTREAARDPDRAGSLLGASTLMRVIVLGVIAPFAVIYVMGGLAWLDMAEVSAAAIIIMMLSIIPGSYGEAVNSVFNARERMELPAILNIFTNLSRFGLGLAALFAGYGVIGLASAALIATAISAGAYHLSLRHLDVLPSWTITREQISWFAVTSWPLLLNALLLNLFFRVDVFVIQAAQGDEALGTYDAAYKFVNMLIILPAYFTLAIFPILSRYAIDGSGRLLGAFQHASRFLLIIAWPITIATIVLAPWMIRVLGGDAFLPESANVLRVIIWFLPLSFVNGVAQYALIATNQQRSISGAFGLAVGFNFLANLIFVPAFGYMAAAAITIATEFVLFTPLALSMHRHIGRPDWLRLLGKPTVAGLVMGVLAALLIPVVGTIAGLVLASLSFPTLLWLLGAIGQADIDLFRLLLSRNQPAEEQS
ncbi:MAG: oligosaccharide flippase family protein [Thermomicrobiaceae bacterium]